MEFKKTIAGFAITASSAFALIGPSTGPSVNLCLAVHEDVEGALHAGTCDASRNNKLKGLELLANGCAVNQISLRTRKVGNKLNIQINPCLPPNVAQL